MSHTHSTAALSSIVDAAMYTLAAVVLVTVPAFFSDVVGVTYAAILWLNCRVVFDALAQFSIAFAISLVAATVVSIAHLAAARALEALFTGLRAVPSLAWLPLMVSIQVIGITRWHSQLIFVMAGVVPLILAQLFHGFAECPQHKLLVARIGGATRRDTFWRIVLPQAHRDIAIAARVGIVMAFILTVVFDFITISGLSMVVDVGEITHFPLRDPILFATMLCANGVLLDGLSRFVAAAVGVTIRRAAA